MANIHTIDEVKSVPNPWQGGYQSTVPGAYATMENQDDEFMIDIGDDEALRVSDLPAWKVPFAICFPCCFGNPLRFLRAATGAFALILIVVFVIQVIVAQSVFSFPPATLVHMGAKSTMLIQNGEVWRLLTATFLSRGIFHLLVNLIILLTYGLQVERRWGWQFTLVMMFTAAISANLLSVVWKPTWISVGAAPVMFGLVGAHFVDLLVGWSRVPHRQHQMTLNILAFLMIFFAICLSADVMADLGGFLVGALLHLGWFCEDNFLDERYHEYVPLVSYLLVASLDAMMIVHIFI